MFITKCGKCHRYIHLDRLYSENITSQNEMQSMIDANRMSRCCYERLIGLPSDNDNLRSNVEFICKYFWSLKFYPMFENIIQESGELTKAAVK